MHLNCNCLRTDTDLMLILLSNSITLAEQEKIRVFRLIVIDESVNLADIEIQFCDSYRIII